MCPCTYIISIIQYPAVSVNYNNIRMRLKLKTALDKAARISYNVRKGYRTGFGQMQLGIVSCLCE